MITNDLLVIPRLPGSLSDIHRLSRMINNNADVFVATNFSTVLFLDIPTIRVVYDLIYPLHPQWQPSINDLRSKHGLNAIDTIVSDVLPVYTKLLARDANSTPDFPPNPAEPIVGKLYGLTYTYQILSAKGLITLTDTIKRQVLSYFSIANRFIRVLPPRLPEYLGERLIHRVPGRGKQKGLRMLYVAGVEPRKNHQLLFLAVEKLVNSLNRSVSLSLIGARNYQSHYISFKKLLDQMREVAEIEVCFNADDRFLRQSYSEASQFVFPSLQEGFGIPLLEAMYMNVPTVALRTQTTEEVCGDSALYVNHPDAMAFARKIVELDESRDLQNRLIERQTTAIRRFTDDDKNARQFKDLLRDIL